MLTGRIKSYFCFADRPALFLLSCLYRPKNCKTFQKSYKRVCEAAKLAYANETKESITSQKLGCRDFWLKTNTLLVFFQ